MCVSLLGDCYWVFDAERKITGPDSVRQLGLPVSDIQAALSWEEDHVEKVYLFKSASYWSFNPQVNRVAAVHPRSMRRWGGLPGHVNAAFQDRYGENRTRRVLWTGTWSSADCSSLALTGYTNFLSGLHNWRFDPVALKLLEGYPRSIGGDFFSYSV